MPETQIGTPPPESEGDQTPVQTSVGTSAQISVWADNSAGPLGELGYAGAVKLTSGRLANRLANVAETYGGLSIDSILKVSASAPGFPPLVPAWAVGRARPPSPRSGSGSAGWLGCRRYWGTVTSRRGPWISVEGYAATLPADGQTAMGIYGWEKLVCGLVDTAVYAGYTPALDLLSRIVRAESFDRTRLVPAATISPVPARRSRQSGTPSPKTSTGGTWPTGIPPWPSSPGYGITTPTGTVLLTGRGSPGHGISRRGCTPTATSTPCPARRRSPTFTTSPATSRS